MALFVIADLHLSKQVPILNQAFENFVAKLQSGDELYILGDLFNFFVGLDSHDEAQSVVKNALAKAKERGVRAFLIHGNRDFLMSSKEASFLNMTLLEDNYLIKLKDQDAHYMMLCHGDMLCTNDHDYQRYARTVNNKCLQSLFRLLPLFIRRKIGARIRSSSMAQESNYRRRDPKIYGVVPKSVDEELVKLLPIKHEHNTTAHHIDDGANKTNEPRIIVVHGHIHVFAAINNESSIYKTRYVLGSWGSYFSYFKVADHGECTLVEVPLDELNNCTI